MWEHGVGVIKRCLANGSGTLVLREDHKRAATTFLPARSSMPLPTQSILALHDVEHYAPYEEMDSSAHVMKAAFLSCVKKRILPNGRCPLLTNRIGFSILTVSSCLVEKAAALIFFVGRRIADLGRTQGLAPAWLQPPEPEGAVESGSICADKQWLHKNCISKYCCWGTCIM